MSPREHMNVPDERLDRFRKIIEVFDRDLIQTIAQRFEVARQIGAVKREQGATVENVEREQELRALHEKWAGEFGVDANVIATLFAILIEESKKIQKNV